MNLNGPLGYSLVHTCNFIKKYSNKKHLENQDQEKN